MIRGSGVKRLLAWAVLCALAAAVSRADADEFLRQGTPPFVKGSVEAPHYPNFVLLAKQLSPAVVNISVEADEHRNDEGGDEMPPRRDPDMPYRSLGSGFIVHEDGYVVTNNHVIDKAEKIIVRFFDDKSEYVATIVGKDLKTDLALLKINPTEKLQTVYFGDSDQLQVGEWVMAIGNQFQLGHTVSSGIVSALSRRVQSPNASPYDAYIQTDASINPGSSGGPLINSDGQVVGVNTAIFSPGRSGIGGTGFNIGIGFAIPINLVKSVITQLKD